jgi:hypothetical protein
MRWLVEFYNGRRGILARYGLEAPLPIAAVRSAWSMVRAEHPSDEKRVRLSLLERANRAGSQDAGGWVLYRITTDNGRESYR